MLFSTAHVVIIAHAVRFENCSHWMLHWAVRVFQMHADAAVQTEAADKSEQVSVQAWLIVSKRH
jgi:hypothetical protein